MKKIKHTLLYSLFAIALVGCNDDFLEKLPQDSLAETNTFSTNNSIEAFTLQFYEMFEAHNETGNIAGSSRPGAGFGLDREAGGDLIQKGTQMEGNSYIWGRMTVPATDEIYTQAYREIRDANLLLKNVPNSELTQIDKDHWLSVGYFFKAFNYFNLLQRYGEVIWLEEAITDESPELYAAKNTRDEVASNILRDLLWAEAHIKDDLGAKDKRFVDKSVVNALISRFGLFEGTWRKHHSLGGESAYLDACKIASEKLIAEFGTLHPNFDQLQNSESLRGTAGIILFKEYNELENFSNMSTTFRASNSTWDITRKGVDKFLTKNGMPVSNPANTQFEGYESFAEFRNRDKRLLYSTPPPYFVTRINNTTWQPTGNPADAEWFSKLQAISHDLGKTLPDLNWRGNVVSKVPNFNLNAVAGFNRTFSGYRVWKHYNELNTGVSSRDFADAPIFRIGEVLLNYAEVMFELGQFNQAIADQTINKLRVRGEVAPMTIAAIGPGFDPTGDPTVDPVLFEIRRERAVELLGEGFRREDLRRWKKMEYASTVKLGRYITAASENNKVPIENNAPIGFVQTVTGTPPIFLEHYYLFPLPSNELVLNPQLKQNPGW